MPASPPGRAAGSAPVAAGQTGQDLGSGRGQRRGPSRVVQLQPQGRQIPVQPGDLAHPPAVPQRIVPAEQVRVVFVYFDPDQPPREIAARTSHLDVPATILAALGDLRDPTLYSLGRGVLDPVRPPFLVLSGWDDCCLVTDRLEIRFATEAYNLFSPDAVTDLDDNPVADLALIRAEKQKYLVPVLEGMSRFLK